MNNLLLVNANATELPLASGSVQCCVTSPPYFSLRSYETGENKDKEIGTENLHDCSGWITGEYCDKCYVCRTLLWTSEVWEVLRDDGILFLNIGDSYSGSGGPGNQYDNKNKKAFTKFKNASNSLHKYGVRRKNLLGIPWRVALAMQANGWILRSDIIWYAKNRMPESVQDRPSKSHEYIFMFSKSEKYYYDSIAISEETETRDKSYRDRDISKLNNIRLMGLMTMGPRFGNAEDARPYFVETKKIFNRIKKLDLPHVEMKYLSMGMTNSYHIALEEDANIVRIGSKIFGERAYEK